MSAGEQSVSTPAPAVPSVELTDGSARFLPNSLQVIFYDQAGAQLFGWDWVEKYMWMVTGERPPAKELADRMLAEFMNAQNAKGVAA